ncbi:MAG TPA: alpha/beta fold hydrolase, partial [Actinomycetota bacterium]|nr:alpha/beta fold hydrolase [Actinomycetota bacterium]
MAGEGGGALAADTPTGAVRESSRRGAAALFAAAIALTLMPAVLPNELGGTVGWALRISAALGGVWAAVGVYRRSRAPIGGVLAAFLGAAAAGVGMGDAGMHLLKQRFSWLAYTTLPSLVAGTILFLLGIVILLTWTRGWWRKVLALGVGAMFLWYVTVPLMVAAYVTHVPETPLSGLTPGDKGLIYRDVELRTSDRLTLRGWYVPSRNDAAVIVLHGSGSNRSTMIDHLTLLARQGYGVLAFDARGHGESEGEAMDFGWLGTRDLDAALDFLAGRADVDPGRVGVFGVSMGAVEALTTAAQDRRISAVVSDGANIASLADSLAL